MVPETRTDREWSGGEAHQTDRHDRGGRNGRQEGQEAQSAKGAPATEQVVAQPPSPRGKKT